MNLSHDRVKGEGLFKSVYVHKHTSMHGEIHYLGKYPRLEA